jgi:N-acetylmuramoyl-L-alanine amidase
LIKTLNQRWLRWGALLLLAALPAVPSHARARHTDAWARDHFATAERMREALNGRPPADRSRHDYQRVINAYRSVYFGAPASTKADPSVVAVAETLVEMGRRFDDDKILNEAIAQYKFLRKEYPGSKYRCDALFTMGEIYKDDLNDPEHARAVFQEFLHRYPHNRLVDDAQQAIAELDRDAEAEKKAQAQKKSGRESADKGKVAKDSSGKSTNVRADAAGDPGTETKAENNSDVAGSDGSDAHANRLPRVTGIRHWSTPDYTRVAIDLESDIKFGSQRIDNPDRIFFDLRGTKLASTLVGKSFDVDDGFLKKIRVAQFQPGRTRVVLEVDNLSDYDAFLLPNPYRLIIDIHGKDAHGKGTRTKPTKDDAAETADVEAPPKAGVKSEAGKADAAAAELQKADAQKATVPGPQLPKPDVPKAELKADLKALAGEPVSKKEQIHAKPKVDSASAKVDSTKADSTRMDSSKSDITKIQPAKLDSSKPDSTKTGVGEAKAAPPAIKKVIVEADDDDPPVKAAPVKAANDAPKPRSQSAVHKADASSDSDSSDITASDPAPTTHMRGKAPPGSTPDLDLHADLHPDRDDVREAKPTASGDRSLIRALGLKIGKIVIDPGHGGHDTGTIGPNGLQEKDLVLEVGRRLGKLLETRLGAEVVYTRKDDTFIPLETRTAIANQQRSDLFISIHANSSEDAEARGVETYYLNFTSSPEALEVAARENAVSEKSIYELQDLVKKIALKEKIEESREFAGDVQESLHSGLAVKSPGIRNRGVKKAPFIVLIGANMPSILAEISFVSNPTDEHRLETSEYRQKIAESLYRGIAKYVNGLSGVKVASKMDRVGGQ